MRIIDILENESWIEKYDFIDEFKNSDYYDLLRDSYKRLNTDILFDSHIHGQDHIERVIFFTHLIGHHYKLDRPDMDVLRNAASLHDTKRVNDGWDTEHGLRAAKESIDFAYCIDEDKNILQAVMAAHACDDKIMDDLIKSFIKDGDDFARTQRLCKFFKDSDGLDRVRINHLDPNYLRNDFSKDLVDFAYELYERY